LEREIRAEEEEKRKEEIRAVGQCLAWIWTHGEVIVDHMMCRGE
jgi:hypothetical protein